MNSKLLLKGLGIILLNNALALYFIHQTSLPIGVILLSLLVFSSLLWFFLLRKEIPIKFCSINQSILGSTLPLILIPMSIIVLLAMDSLSFNTTVLGFVFLNSLLIAVYEELLFRAIALGSLISSGIKPMKAILLASFLFSISHIIFTPIAGYATLFLLVNTFLMGVILGFIYFETKNILYVIAIHCVWDFAVFLNQRSVNQDLGSIITVVLLAITLLYFSWSIRKIREL